MNQRRYAPVGIIHACQRPAGLLKYRQGSGNFFLETHRLTVTKRQSRHYLSQHRTLGYTQFPL